MDHEFLNWLLAENTFSFSCFAGEILNEVVLFIELMSRMERVQFAGAAINLSGTYSMETTSYRYNGDFSAE